MSVSFMVPTIHFRPFSDHAKASEYFKTALLAILECKKLQYQSINMVYNKLNCCIILTECL